MMSCDLNYKQKVGGNWEEIARWQFEFLKEFGLEPEDKLLDIGCGPLHGAIKFIPYLDAGNYYGVDKSRELLDEGIDKELTADMEAKDPHIMHFSDFQFSEKIGKTFDCFLTQSVFTHLPPDKVEKCIAEAKKVMKPDSRFLATFWKGDEIDVGNVHAFRDQEYARVEYNLGFFDRVCQENGLNVVELNELECGDHPHGQDTILIENDS